MEKRRIQVPVATIWKTKDSPRSIDKLALKGKTKSWVRMINDKQSIQLCDDDLVNTQALFNDELIIDHFEGKWAKIFVKNQKNCVDPKGYPGWIPKNLLSNKIEGKLINLPLVIVTTKKAFLYNKKKFPILELSLGTILPKNGFDDNYIKVLTPLGNGYIKKGATVLSTGKKNLGVGMVQLGLQFLGKRYLWGGISSFGFDCSGFMYTLHRVFGLNIPRDAQDQIKSGKVVSFNNVLPGDLVFFAYKHGRGFVHHVGMYIGNEKMIESRTPGASVDIASLKEDKFVSELAGFRRYWR